MEQQNYSAFAEVTLLINYLCANNHGRPFVLIDGLYLIINVNYTTSKVLFSDKLQRARQHSSILLIKSGFGLEYIHILGSDKTWWMTILFEHWTRDSLLWCYSKLVWFSFLWHLHEAWQVTNIELHRLKNVTIILKRDFLLFEILIHETWQSSKSKLSPQKRWQCMLF